ncbi:MAG: ferredoxin:thioredoxin reductase [Planctomycetes bacterium]|nr:ferredoxin:thioredoxin reductase [Planctomycetota bacterium]
MDENESAANIRARLENYLIGKPFTFNPEPGVADMIIKAMAKKRAKFGEDYCPCRMVTGDAEKDRDIICPCVYHIAEIEEDGHCHCRLFSKPVTGPAVPGEAAVER